MRQYAQELLAASGEEDGVRTRHLAFYGALAEERAPGIAGPDQGDWIARLDLERENILCAHAWCDHAPRGRRAGPASSRATRKTYWINRGLLGLGHRVVAEALARPGAQSRDELRCRALFDAGQLAFFMGRYGEAQRYLEESLVVARELGNKQRIAAALQPLGMACLGQGNLATARTHLEEGARARARARAERDLAAAMNALGALHRMQGALDDGRNALRGCGRRSFAEPATTRAAPSDLLNLAMVAILRDSARRRARILARGDRRLGIARPARAWGCARSKSARGSPRSRGDFERAARFYGVAEAQNGSTGLHRDPADEAFLAPLMEKARERPGARGYPGGRGRRARARLRRGDRRGARLARGRSAA